MESMQTRATYVARYGKAVWTKAVALATRHRLRASREYGQTEHFTAPEWLDQCAYFDFRCPLCNKSDPLLPHHRRELCKGSSNKIDNILPICHVCHLLLHPSGPSCAPGWLAEQRALCESFHVGDQVHWTYFRFSLSHVYQIAEIVQPALMSSEGRLRNWGSDDSGGLVFDGRQVTHWTSALVRMVGELPGCGYILQEMAHFDADAWFADQQALTETFKVGDWVRGPIPQGRICEIVPPIFRREPSYLQPAKAHLGWVTKKRTWAQRLVTAELDQLTKIVAPPTIPTT